MTQEPLDKEKLLDEYMLDVIHRNNAMKEYQDSLKKEYTKKPLEEIKSLLKTNMEEERAYLGLKDDNRKPYNDFELLQREIPRNIVAQYYRDTEEVKQINESAANQMNSLKENPSLSTEEKDKKISLIREIAGQKLDVEYQKHLPEIEDRGYEKQTYIAILARREVDVYNRQVVQEEFNANRKDDDLQLFIEDEDKGNCTKSLTVSLYKLQEKYGVPVFDELKDIEDIAHPKELSKKLSKYVRTAETGNLEDLNLKKGDIILLTRQSTSKPGHAMMCHGFDENNEPLLLGFSSIDKGIKANKDRRGEVRKGIIIDVQSLIEDAIKSKEHQNTISLNTKQHER